VGNTTVAANHVMVLAESQKRVLAVDACPGKASLTRIFGIEPTGAGLCEQLQRWLDAKHGSAAGPGELVQIAETLTICTSSAVPRPALPLLASEAFTRFASDMSHFFDAIVIDTEPLQSASDAVVLQRLVDGYVMVLARHQSTTRGLQNVCSRIEPERILGFVFNEHHGQRER
jgi:Mrp family chromosome partitioning ATPase